MFAVVNEAEILGTFPYSQVGSCKLSGLLKSGLFLKHWWGGQWGPIVSVLRHQDLEGNSFSHLFYHPLPFYWFILKTQSVLTSNEMPLFREPQSDLRSYVEYNLTAHCPFSLWSPILVGHGNIWFPLPLTFPLEGLASLLHPGYDLDPWPSLDPTMPISAHFKLQMPSTKALPPLLLRADLTVITLS